MTTTKLSDLLFVSLVDCTPLAPGCLESTASFLGWDDDFAPKELNFQGMHMFRVGLDRLAADYKNKGRTCHLRVYICE